jgi:hypothetical protein
LGRSKVAPIRTARPRWAGYAGGVSEGWRDTLLLDVPMRGVIAVDRTELLREDDPRFERDGVVLVTEGGRFAHSVQRGSTRHHGVPRMGPDAAARASETLESSARLSSLFVAVVDTDGMPIGLLGWDDVVRFALERGGGVDDACWDAPASMATRFFNAITPLAGILERRLGPVRTVREVAAAMLRVPLASLGGLNSRAESGLLPARLLGSRLRSRW